MEIIKIGTFLHELRKITEQMEIYFQEQMTTNKTRTY